MNQFHFIIRSIINMKANTLIKIISLTLGLTAAVVLFSKVAFEMGYDTSYPDAERIYRLGRKTSSDGKKFEQNPRLYAAVVRDLKAELPEIEQGAAIFIRGGEYLQYEGRIFKEEIIMGDEYFFDLFGVTLLEGDFSSLSVPGQVFISQSTAKRFFGDKNPVGQMINRNQEAMPVAGVFKDVNNSHLVYSVFITAEFDETGWRNPDPFTGYIKLASGITPEQFEARVKEVLPKFIDIKAEEAKGNAHEYYLYPVSQLHSGTSDVKQMVVILSILAFSLLFVAAMNYVLISISSLAERAKTVGVHKCNGASNANIFRNFFFETAGILLAALVFALLLIFAFRAPIEGIIQTPLYALFSAHNLWVTGTVTVLLLLLAGIIPAMVFSAIPVTTLFHAYSVNKKQWKRVLLFVQFTGATFMVTLLAIIVKQYDLLLHVDLGYNTKNLYYSENISGVPRTQVAMLKSELERMPEVASVSIASTLPVNYLEGLGAANIEDEDHRIHCLGMGIDSDYLSTMGIKLLSGENAGGNSLSYTRALVNESFVKQMGWTDSPVGKSFISGLSGKDKPVQVIGVIEDFKISNLNKKEFADLYPAVNLFPLDIGEENWLFGWERVMIKLHGKDDAVLTRINKMMQDLLNKPNAFFIDYNYLIAENYREALFYRDSILAASLFLLFITALGLIGFTQDEIGRRRKEIAIRKIAGAGIVHVLYAIAKGIVLVALPALCVGLAFSGIVGADWLQQFAVKISLNFFLFASCAAMVLAGILSCVTIRAWRVASENPVKHLRTE
jgi:putative ABC transport system permease protein